jgi:hypothetical protein
VDSQPWWDARRRVRSVFPVAPHHRLAYEAPPFQTPAPGPCDGRQSRSPEQRRKEVPVAGSRHEHDRSARHSGSFGQAATEPLEVFVGRHGAVVDALVLTPVPGGIGDHRVGDPGPEVRHDPEAVPFEHRDGGPVRRRVLCSAVAMRRGRTRATVHQHPGDCRDRGRFCRGVGPRVTVPAAGQDQALDLLQTDSPTWRANLASAASFAG